MWCCICSRGVQWGCLLGGQAAAANVWQEESVQPSEQADSEVVESSESPYCTLITLPTFDMYTLIYTLPTFDMYVYPYLRTS